LCRNLKLEDKEKLQIEKKEEEEEEEGRTVLTPFESYLGRFDGWFCRAKYYNCSSPIAR
jgi:hypothetical protein